MIRTPEPELMTDPARVAAYAGADLSELHEPLLLAFAERFPAFGGGRLLDLGCGAADMTIRFARAYPALEALGVDGSRAMIAEGRRAVEAAGLSARIRLECRRLPDASLEASAFDAVIANSVLHHLADPGVLWSAIRRAAREGAAVMVSDLRRPASPAAARRIVERYASGAHPALQEDFFHSLCAAYSEEEVVCQLEDFGLEAFSVEGFGEAHLLVRGWR